MKRQFKLTTIAASVLLASGCHIAFAAGRQMSDAQLKAMVESIVNSRTADLQKEVSGLRHEVVSLRKQLAVKNGGKTVYVQPAHEVHYHEHYIARGYIPRGYIHNGYHTQMVDYHHDYTPIHPAALARSAHESPITPIFVAGTPVVSSPYIGVRSAFDGSDLIVNESSVNLDARLLKQSQALANVLIKEGAPLPEHPIIELSGVLEGQATETKNYPGNTQADIDLTEATLDTFIHVNPCVQGFISLGYDNSRAFPTRVINSRVFVDKGFVTIGDLNRSPFYMTFGQLFVPFGQYSSYLVSDSVAKDLGRTKARPIIFGLYPQAENGDGLYGTAYIYKSDTRHADKSVAGGGSLGYKFNIHKLNLDFSVGGISELADSLGAQLTGASIDAFNVVTGTPTDRIEFQGFGTNRDSEALEHAVPGLDLRTALSYKHLTFLGEYVGATRSFAPENLSFNNHGARPTATHLEGVLTFNIHNRPGSFALGYGWTTEALGLNLPEQRFDATINYAFFRDTLESLEFRHDKMYSEDDVAGGGNFVQTFSPSRRYIEEVTLQMDVYF